MKRGRIRNLEAGEKWKDPKEFISLSDWKNRKQLAYYYMRKAGYDMGGPIEIPSERVIRVRVPAWIPLVIMGIALFGIFICNLSIARGEEVYLEKNPIYDRTDIKTGPFGQTQGWIEKDPIYKDRYNVYDKNGFRTGTTIEKNPVYKGQWSVKPPTLKIVPNGGGKK